MPKMKTHSSAKKRFKLTGSGKIKRRKCGKSHLLTKKDKDRKKKLGHADFVKPCDERRVKLMLCI